MYRGHIDTVTRTEVRGWAASDDRPDGLVDVSIFIDGRKVGQVACALPRPDLRQLGVFGAGMHGFRYEFPEPLERASDKRVTVCISATGKALNNGDVEIRRDDSIHVRARAGDRLIGEPEPIPAPCNPRSLFETFALFDERTGMYEMLSRLDFAEINPRNAHFVVFGDMAVEPVPYDAETKKYCARDYVNELLLSGQFQSNLIPLFLRSFPEKRRLIFVHIPKCAGTDLSANLMSRFPFIHQQMTQPTWMTKEHLFRAISRLVLNIQFFDRIFVTGHNSLEYYTLNGLVRPMDRAFTIVRDPLRIATSQVNYVMTKLTADARSGSFGPDTRDWLNSLHLDTLPIDQPPTMVQSLCSAILHNTKIVQPNSMCSWLGGDGVEAVIRLLSEHDVEITTTDNYNEWLHQTWGITTETQLNRSEMFISLETMSHHDLAYIRDTYSEDIKLYSTICKALQRTDKLSVLGGDLCDRND